MPRQMEITPWTTATTTSTDRRRVTDGNSDVGNKIICLSSVEKQKVEQIPSHDNSLFLLPSLAIHGSGKSFLLLVTFNL